MATAIAGLGSKARKDKYVKTLRVPIKTTVYIGENTEGAGGAIACLNRAKMGRFVLRAYVRIQRFKKNFNCCAGNSCR